MAYDSSETRFQRKLREELEERIGTKERDIALGSASDFSMYKNQCGYIRGLKDALQLVEDMIENGNRD